MASLEERGDVGVAAAAGSSSAGLGVGAPGGGMEPAAGGAVLAGMQEEAGIGAGVGLRREGAGPEADQDAPPKKRARPQEGEAVKLEERLYSVLCCTVCLDLPKASVYQCTNGHLMCAGCFIHLLADSRLKEEQATCPNCRCEISKSLCCRNLAVEKAVSELPCDCGFCMKQFPRSVLERHQKEECQDRVTQCKYKRIGCPWQGPFHELTAHEAECSHPTKTGNELMDILDEMDQNHRKEMQLYNSIFSLLCFEKIGFTEVQFRPYRTDDFITRLYYETPRFTVLNQTWVLKARVNDSERNPNLSWSLRRRKDQARHPPPRLQQRRQRDGLRALAHHRLGGVQQAPGSQEHQPPPLHLPDPEVMGGGRGEGRTAGGSGEREGGSGNTGVEGGKGLLGWIVTPHRSRLL
uniref:Zinc finger TRAF-type containing 1 n=1 Tax=Scleropages formosus TaxID=113540 RepID=A0A8C9WB32_SCLFO